LTKSVKKLEEDCELSHCGS